MRIITVDECAEWLSARNFHFLTPLPNGDQGYVFMPPMKYIHMFPFPDLSNQQLVLARRLTHWIESPDLLIWLTGSSSLAADERRIVQDVRAVWGECRPLDEAPGYLCSFETDMDASVCNHLLNFMMAFHCDGFIMQGDNQSILRISGETIWALTQDKRQHHRMAKNLDAVGEYEWDENPFTNEDTLARHWRQSPTLNRTS